MTAPQTQYWAFRVDRTHLTVLDEELHAGRLRQGWGWDERQNLKKLELDEGAGRNRGMLKVKKNDRILIPHLPQPGLISIAEATEDWDSGYRFSVLKKTGDHGHIFPAKCLLNFHRNNGHVSAGIRGTFRNLGRFWNISGLQHEIEALLQIPLRALEGARRSSIVGKCLWRI